MLVVAPRHGFQLTFAGPTHPPNATIQSDKFWACSNTKAFIFEPLRCRGWNCQTRKTAFNLAHTSANSDFVCYFQPESRSIISTSGSSQSSESRPALTMGSSAAFRHYARNILAKQELRTSGLQSTGVNCKTETHPFWLAAYNVTDEQLCNSAYSHSQAESSRLSALLDSSNWRMVKQLKWSQNQLKR